MTPNSIKLWRRVRTLGLLVTGAAFLIACGSAATATGKKKKNPADPGDEFFGEDIDTEEGLTPTENPDSGAFGAGARPASNKDGGGNTRPDGGGTTQEGGAPVVTYCTGSIKGSDVVVVELMIASRAGSSDDGEWVELESTRDCTLKLKGLSIESPRGAAESNKVSITEDFELPPYGRFVVAGSADPTKNGIASGKVFSWEATDVLKNDGDSLVVKMGAATIDTLTYPSFSNLQPGRTLAFPSDCALGVRTDFARWSLTFDEYKPGKKGTPNAANDDVACY